MRWRYPRNIGVNQYNVTDESRKAIDSMVNDVISEYGIETENVINYRSQGFTLAQDGNHFYGVNQSYTGMDLGDEMPTSSPSSFWRTITVWRAGRSSWPRMRCWSTVQRGDTEWRDPDSGHILQD